jgi:two-component system sensor histidine kinase/response regulator
VGRLGPEHVRASIAIAMGAVCSIWAWLDGGAHSSLALVSLAGIALSLGSLGVLTLQARLPPGKPAASERPQASSAVAASQRLTDQLLRSVGRDVHASASNTLAMAELLLDTKLNPRQRRYAQNIEASVRSLSRAVRETLEFAGTASGDYQVRREEFDLRRSVDETVQQFGRAAHEKDLELAARFDADVPSSALADPARFAQVLAQLLGNAIKFTDRGEVLVRVCNAASRDPGADGSASRQARIEVRDTGCGLASAERARVFDSFAEGGELMVRPHRGAGLGLAISKRLVEAMGGAIGCDSTPRVGSTFWFTISLTPADSPAGEPQRLPAMASLRRMLIVEPNRSARETLKEMVNGWAVECETCSSAYEAFGRIEDASSAAAPFDLLVIAERTSDLAGVDLVRALGTQPALRQMPVLLLTHTASPLSAAEISVATAAALTKPIAASQLRSAIVDLLGRSRSPAAATARTPPKTGSEYAQVPRALVVDDNEVNQFAVVELLGELGLASDVAHNGREAIEMVAREHYTIVFMDCEMPEMDGYEATRRIRASEVAPQRVPIVALTAHSAPEAQAEGLRAGMDEYMVKPVRQQMLEAVLARWASRERAREPV